MGRTGVRLKDIADKTGFSANTVSLALRESPRIPRETRDIIQAAARELNYLPNQIAKSLVSRESKTIGLVLTQLTNPVLTKTAQAIELALAEHGYVTTLATSNNRLDDEIQVVETLRARQVDGILIYPRSHQRLDHVRRLRKANHPVVVMMGQPEGIDSVGVDDFSGALKATTHLIALGHRKIGILDSHNPRGNLEKLEGYKAALAAHGLSYDPALVVDPKGSTPSDGYRAAAELKQSAKDLTAIFASTDSVGIGAEFWCLENGLRVPEDIAVIGYDNIEFSEFARVPLSSINYDAEDVSRRSVDRLLTLIRAGDHLPEPVSTLIDPDLVVRQSTVKTDAKGA